MDVNDVGPHAGRRGAASYNPGYAAAVRRTCLEVATRLGDFRDDWCVAGGLVPSLLVPAGSASEAHVGTIDLDLGLSLAVLDQGRYEQIADRLRHAGFAADRNETGRQTSQRWRSPDGITIDFLIAPSAADDRGGRLRNLQPDFAAFIIPGLDLAFRDSVLVTIEDELNAGTRTAREVRVCGPAAFIALKAIAFAGRGSEKDAYDMYYLLRHYQQEARELGQRLGRLRPHAQIESAARTIRQDFCEGGGLGPGRVAAFLGTGSSELRADAAGFFREFLAGLDR